MRQPAADRSLSKCFARMQIYVLLSLNWTSMHCPLLFRQTSRRAPPPAGGCAPAAAASSKRPWPLPRAQLAQPPCRRQHPLLRQLWSSRQRPRLRQLWSSRQRRRLCLHPSHRQRRSLLARCLRSWRQAAQALRLLSLTSRRMTRWSRRQPHARPRRQPQRMLWHLRRPPCSQRLSAISLLASASAPACQPCQSRRQQQGEGALAGSACPQRRRQSMAAGLAA